MYQSLHSHTTQSDGHLSHKELLDVAKKYNVDCIAFTEHDSLMSEKMFKELKQDAPVNWINGIEIDTGLPHDLPGSISGLHIVGLFVDPFNKNLLDHCKKAQAARIERMTKIIKNLAGIGIHITEEDCLKASSGESVGRPHIVQAILSYPENVKRIEEIREDMEQAAQNDAKIKEEYDLMMQQGEHEYPYVLFLSADSFIPNIYLEIPYKPKLDDSVKLIRDAGGLSVIAHYFTAKKKLNLEFLEKLFAENRLDGAETVYGLWLSGTDAEKGLLEERQQLRDLIKKYKRVTSGGADVHSEDDLKAFAEKPDYAGETIGLAQKIIKNFKPNTEFSNL